MKAGYTAQSSDLSAEADAFIFSLLRQKTVTQRLSGAAALNCHARQFSIRCFRKRFAALTEKALARKLAEAWLQESCPPDYVPTGNEMTWIQDSISLAATLHRIFEALAIPYYITGGVAAIAYGEPRTTQDLDVVLSLPLSSVKHLGEWLEAGGFYVAGLEDVMSGQSQVIQIIHIQSISRADLMISGNGDFDQSKFARKQAYELPDGTVVNLLSPEDLILSKLKWRTENQSEKQWRDILGILKTQTELDRQYLEAWALRLGVAEDLQRTFVEAGL